MHENSTCPIPPDEWFSMQDKWFSMQDEWFSMQDEWKLEICITLFLFLPYSLMSGDFDNFQSLLHVYEMSTYIRSYH